MMLMICATSVCVLLSVHDIKKMLKMDTGRAKTLTVYSIFMLFAIIMICVVTWLDDYSLVGLLNLNY